MLSLITALTLAFGALGQDAKSTGDAKVQAVRVPTYPNVSCPIMGKPISARLFTDTAYGRIWICCKSCIEDIQADVETSYRAAYPTTKRVENELSPVSRKPLPEEERVRVELQGFEFHVLDEREAATAREHAQVVLAKLHEPELVDLENKTCPLADAPTVAHAFVVIEKSIVRLSSPRLREQVEADPGKVLRKAREIAEAERAKKAAPGAAQ